MNIQLASNITKINQIVSNISKRNQIISNLTWPCTPCQARAPPRPPRLRSSRLQLASPESEPKVTSGKWNKFLLWKQRIETLEAKNWDFGSKSAISSPQQFRSATGCPCRRSSTPPWTWWPGCYWWPPTPRCNSPTQSPSKSWCDWKWKWLCGRKWKWLSSKKWKWLLGRKRKCFWGRQWKWMCCRCVW